MDKSFDLTLELSGTLNLTELSPEELKQVKELWKEGNLLKLLYLGFEMDGKFSGKVDHWKIEVNE